MAQVTLRIGGRDYIVGCRDGEEAHLAQLGRLLDARAEEALRAVGGTNETRQLLLAGLLLADELASAGGGAAPAPAPPADDTLGARLEALANRVEAIAAGLEGAHAKA